MLILGTLTILGLVPLYDRVVLPMLESKGWAPTSLQRGGLAQLWMGIAMLVACVVWLFSGRLRRETSTSASPNTISVVWMARMGGREGRERRNFWRIGGRS